MIRRVLELRPGWVGALAALAWLVTAGQGFAQRLGQARMPDFAWTRWLGALILCLALALGGALALRARLRGASPSPTRLPAWLRSPPAARRLRVLESVRASPTLEVCLLTCDGQDYLLAATPHGAVQLKAQVAAAAETA